MTMEWILVLLMFLAVVGLAVWWRRRPLNAVRGVASGSGGARRDARELAEGIRRTTVMLRLTDGESTSWFGGLPPKFAGFTWPTKDKKSLWFLACVDLAKVPAEAAIEWLPRDGRLLFFYAVEEQPWGFDPNDRGSWCVVYVPAETKLAGEAALPADLEAEWRIARHAVEFVVTDLLPPWERTKSKRRAMSEAEMDELDELREELYGESPRHQLGGEPDPVQGDEMELECQLAANGVNCGGPAAFKSRRANDLRAGAADWSLLLQIDSDDDLAIWGDMGRLYFWVQREEARRKRFENVWLVLQCS
jgi:uncharacterized protein YwqG